MKSDLPRHVRERGKGYEVRIGVPKELRPFIGKSELNEIIEGSRAQAIRRSHAVLAEFHQKLDAARQQLNGPKLTVVPSKTRLWSDREMAQHLYHSQVEQEQNHRDAGVYTDLGMDPRYYTDGFADAYESRLQRVVRGAAPDDEIGATIGWAINEFIADGVLKVERGTPEWRALARKLAGIQIEVIKRRREMDASAAPKQPEHPLLAPAPAAAPEAVSIMGLFDDYFVELQASQGKGAEAKKRWRPGFEALVKHLGHDDATRVTDKDLAAFKADLLKKLNAKTVRDGIIAGIRAVFRWAKSSFRISHNPAIEIEVKFTKPTLDREKAFTDEEAVAVLTAARDYQPNIGKDGRSRESKPITDAKRWTPWLCAYTGARIAELTQLRRQDIQERDGITFIRITPEAGSVKTGVFRDIPVHPHLVELGFLDFVSAAPAGPLFYVDNPNRSASSRPSQHTAGRVSDWVRDLGVIGEKVQPCYGWRHRFKAVGLELEIAERTLNGIQGHGKRDASDHYGHVSMKAKMQAISKFPRYKLKP